MLRDQTAVLLENVPESFEIFLLNIVILCYYTYYFHPKYWDSQA